MGSCGPFSLCLAGTRRAFLSPLRLEFTHVAFDSCRALVARLQTQTDKFTPTRRLALSCSNKVDAHVHFAKHSRDTRFVISMKLLCNCERRHTQFQGSLLVSVCKQARSKDKLDILSHHGRKMGGGELLRQCQPIFVFDWHHTCIEYFE